METKPPNLSTPPPPPSTWGQHGHPYGGATPEKKSRSPWPFLGCGCLILVLVLGVVFIGGFLKLIGGAMQSGLSSASFATDDSIRITERTVVRGSGDRVVHIDLEGVITGAQRGAGFSMVEDLQNQLKKAIADNKVKAIVVRINSPGGEVTASDRLHHLIQEANKLKPVVAYMDTIAASGGYYAACGARKIMAHPTTLTGSIGVIIAGIDYSELLGKVGVSMQAYKSGKFKDMLSGARPPTEEEAAYLNAMVRETYERFLEVVSAARGKPVDELRDSPAADGRIYSGKVARAKGMVDATGFIEDAYAEAMNLAGIKDATVVRYHPHFGLFSALGLMSTEAARSNPARVELDVSNRLLPRLTPGVPYYLHLPAATGEN
jgi:protease-4